MILCLILFSSKLLFTPICSNFSRRLFVLSNGELSIFSFSRSLSKETSLLSHFSNFSRRCWARANWRACKIYDQWLLLITDSHHTYIYKTLVLFPLHVLFGALAVLLLTVAVTLSILSSAPVSLRCKFFQRFYLSFIAFLLFHFPKPAKHLCCGLRFPDSNFFSLLIFTVLLLRGQSGEEFICRWNILRWYVQLGGGRAGAPNNIELFLFSFFPIHFLLGSGQLVLGEAGDLKDLGLLNVAILE